MWLVLHSKGNGEELGMGLGRSLSFFKNRLLGAISPGKTGYNSATLSICPEDGGADSQN